MVNIRASSDDTQGSYNTRSSRLSRGSQDPRSYYDSRRGSTKSSSEGRSKRHDGDAQASKSGPRDGGSSRRSSQRSGKASGRQDGSRRGSTVKKFLPPDPLPNHADKEERERRKSYEKQSGGFDWTDGVELALTGAFVLFSVDKVLSNGKSDKK